MLNKNVIYEALKRSLTPDPGQDSVISLLIHDVFGGEILKTHAKKKWHFYNRIDGERVDFTLKKKSPSIGKSSKIFHPLLTKPTIISIRLIIQLSLCGLSGLLKRLLVSKNTDPV